MPAAATQPANSVSVTSEGADPTGAADSTQAFRNAISAANSAGESVWIPSGTYLVSSALQVNSATIAGAGDWYSQIKTNEFIDNTSAVSGPVNLSGFAILGSTVGRHDDSTANAIDGSLGSGFTVNGLWIQDTNVGFWLQYGNSNCTVENTVVESTDADGLNFNGNATNCTVKNNFLRNTGDDGLAIWSYPSADSGITFANNTIVQPTLANGIADYGGSNNTISNNVIADTEPLGSGIAISNEQFLSPFTPLSGTITVSGNYLIRAGAENPNWGHPMGAVRFDAYDSAFSNVTVNYSGGAILDSPYEAFEFVAGAGTGNAVNGVNISNVNVQNLGTVVMQAETTGTASVGGVTASGVGVSGAYNNAYPSNTAGGYTFNLGSGNSGWSTTPVLTAFPNPAQPGSLTASPCEPVVRRRGVRVDQRGADGDGVQPGQQRGLGLLGQRQRAVQPDQHLREFDRRGRLLRGQRQVLPHQRRQPDRRPVRRHQRTGQPADRRAVRHGGHLHHQPRPGAAGHGEQLLPDVRRV